MSTARKAGLALAIVIIVVIAGAAVFVLMTPPAKKGTVSVYVKDLPVDWSHVNVTFSEVSIHKANATNNSGWVTIKIKAQTIDFADLTNVSQLLASSNVSEGKYTQLRITVSSATGTMTNGTVVNFTVPSGELKTTHPFTVTSGHTETLTLDFDLDHSIVQAGSNWIFTPVLGSINES